MVEFGSYKFNMVQWGSIGFSKVKFIQLSQCTTNLPKIMNLEQKLDLQQNRAQL